MLTRNQRKKIDNMNNTTETTPTNMESKIKIPQFSGEGFVKIENWLKLFEKKTEARPQERHDLLSEVLTESALNYYLEQDLFEETWEVTRTKLITYFSKGRDMSSQQFIDLKLEDCENFEEYFRKKTDAAKKLKVDESFLLELLTNGLSRQLKLINLPKNCKDVNEWYLFNKTAYYQLKEEKSNNKQKVQMQDQDRRPMPIRHQPTTLYRPPHYPRPPQVQHGNYGRAPHQRPWYPTNDYWTQPTNSRNYYNFQRNEIPRDNARNSLPTNKGPNNDNL